MQFCAQKSSTSGILTSAYTVRIPSYTSALVPFFNPIPLPALSCPRPSFEINVVIAFPLCPQHWEMTWQRSWDADNPRPRWARELGPDAGEQRALLGLFSISYMITEVMIRAVCLTNCTECEAITCADRKKHCFAPNYLNFYLWNRMNNWPPTFYSTSFSPRSKVQILTKSSDFKSQSQGWESISLSQN